MEDESDLCETVRKISRLRRENHRLIRRCRNLATKSVVLPPFVLWSRCEGNIIKYYTIIIIEILHYVYNFRELLLEQTRLS